MTLSQQISLLFLSDCHKMYSLLKAWSRWRRRNSYWNLRNKCFIFSGFGGGMPLVSCVYVCQHVSNLVFHLITPKISKITEICWYGLLHLVLFLPHFFFLKGVHNTTLRDIDFRFIMDLLIESKDQSKKK